MSQIYGKFDEELPKSNEFLTLEFSLDSTSLKQKWRNNGLSADFMADYFATFFPGGAAQAGIKNAVSFVANELLENTMKYGDDSSPVPARVSLHLMPEKLIFITQNGIKLKHISGFKSLIEEILTNDVNDLYVQRLEENSASEDSKAASGLGIITMIMDYGAEFGWKFEQLQVDDAKVNLVTTMVQLPTDAV
ncbi:MAG: DUF6272 family protein [Pseudanabaenaceae cyanobacterium bins.68]|nr:DUF6272 family protein [Pseudanabaenaceae cyanobacterium bins.68]